MNTRAQSRIEKTLGDVAGISVSPRLRCQHFVRCRFRVRRGVTLESAAQQWALGLQILSME